MWYNKVNGKVYIGSALDAQTRRKRYYTLSNLCKRINSGIHRNILKYGHNNLSFFILELLGETLNTFLQRLITRKKYYLDFFLETSKSNVLNIRPVKGHGQKFKLWNFSIYKLIGRKHLDKTKLFIKTTMLKDNNPNYSKSNVVSTKIRVRVRSKLTNKEIL